ncbi:MAG: helix-turn-helix transcriptional regulator, partial [Bacteroidota bacterium]
SHEYNYEGYWQLKNDQQIRYLDLVPDGYFELVLVLDGQVLFRPPRQEYYQKMPPAGIIGQSLQVFPLVLGPGANLLCIKWYPWAPKCFLHHPVHSFTNQALDLESVVPSNRFRQLIRDLRSSRDFEAQTGLMDRFFEQHPMHLNQHTPFLEYAVQQLFARSGAIRVESLGDSVSASNRYIQKVFKDQVGLSPKQFARVIRVKKASVLIQENRFKGQFSQVAAQLGYFDQSHFLKDFRSIVGLSPSAYSTMQQMGDMAGQHDYLSQWDYV